MNKKDAINNFGELDKLLEGKGIIKDAEKKPEIIADDLEKAGAENASATANRVRKSLEGVIIQGGAPSEKEEAEGIVKKAEEEIEKTRAEFAKRLDEIEENIKKSKNVLKREKLKPETRQKHEEEVQRLEKEKNEIEGRLNNGFAAKILQEALSEVDNNRTAGMEAADNNGASENIKNPEKVENDKEKDAKDLIRELKGIDKKLEEARKKNNKKMEEYYAGQRKAVKEQLNLKDKEKASAKANEEIKRLEDVCAKTISEAPDAGYPIKEEVIKGVIVNDIYKAIKSGGLSGDVKNVLLGLAKQYELKSELKDIIAEKNKKRKENPVAKKARSGGRDKVIIPEDKAAGKKPEQKPQRALSEEEERLVFNHKYEIKQLESQLVGSNKAKKEEISKKIKGFKEALENIIKGTNMAAKPISASSVQKSAKTAPVSVQPSVDKNFQETRDMAEKILRDAGYRDDAEEYEGLNELNKRLEAKGIAIKNFNPSELNQDNSDSRDKAFRRMFQEAFGNVATHGLNGKDAEKRHMLRKESDLDGESSLALLRAAGVRNLKVGYIPAGKESKGKINIDTNDFRVKKREGEKGLVGIHYDRETNTLYIDHHTEEFNNTTSATKVLFDALLELKLIDDKPEYKKLAEFVTVYDNQDYRVDRNEYAGDKFSRTLLGLAKEIQPGKIKEVIGILKTKKNFQDRLTDKELKNLGFLHESKGKNINQAEIKANQRKEDMAKLEELEANGFIIDSPEYGKIAIDIGGKIANGFEAAKAYGCDSYIKWFPGRSFFISSTKPLDFDAGQGITVRGTMKMKTLGDKSPLTVNLEDIILKMTGGKIDPAVLEKIKEESQKKKAVQAAAQIQSVQPQAPSGPEPVSAAPASLDSELDNLLKKKESINEQIASASGGMYFNSSKREKLKELDEQIAALNKKKEIGDLQKQKETLEQDLANGMGGMNVEKVRKLEEIKKQIEKLEGREGDEKAGEEAAPKEQEEESEFERKLRELKEEKAEIEKEIQAGNLGMRITEKYNRLAEIERQIKALESGEEIVEGAKVEEEEAQMLIGGEGRERKGRRKDFTKTEFAQQAGKTLAGALGTLFGVKSIVDVPAYLYQRYRVRGMFGKGKGVEGSIEELLASSQNKNGKVIESIKDLNKRLKLTKEGEQKHSEQRKLIADLIRKNRHKNIEEMSREERGKEIQRILELYTTTKVTGMQALRETVNSAMVASGAVVLRGVSYGLLDAAERYQNLSKENKIKGSSNKPLILEDVVIGGIVKTLKEARFRDDEGKKTKRQKSMDLIKAWGRIIRYAGIGSTMSFRPEAFAADADRLLDAVSGKTSLGEMGDNFQGNAERIIGFYENVGKGAVKTLSGKGAISEKPEIIAPIEKPKYEPPIFTDKPDSRVDFGAQEFGYQGGKSIWQEAERQLGARFNVYAGGEETMEVAKTFNTDIIKDAITSNPARYGLNEGDNLDKLSQDQLKNIDWDLVFGDVKGSFVSELSEESGESILRNNEALRNFMAEHPNAPRTSENYENILLGKGDTGEKIIPRSEKNAENPFASNPETPYSDLIERHGKAPIAFERDYNAGLLDKALENIAKNNLGNEPAAEILQDIKNLPDKEFQDLREALERAEKIAKPLEGEKLDDYLPRALIKENVPTGAQSLDYISKDDPSFIFRAIVKDKSIDLDWAEKAGIKVKDGINAGERIKLHFLNDYKFNSPEEAKEFFDLSEKTKIGFRQSVFKDAFARLPEDFSNEQKVGFMKFFAGPNKREGVLELLGIKNNDSTLDTTARKDDLTIINNYRYKNVNLNISVSDDGKIAVESGNDIQLGRVEKSFFGLPLFKNKIEGNYRIDNSEDIRTIRGRIEDIIARKAPKISDAAVETELADMTAEEVQKIAEQPASSNVESASTEVKPEAVPEVLEKNAPKGKSFGDIENKGDSMFDELKGGEKGSSIIFDKNSSYTDKIEAIKNQLGNEKKVVINGYEFHKTNNGDIFVKSADKSSNWMLDLTSEKKFKEFLEARDKAERAVLGGKIKN